GLGGGVDESARGGHAARKRDGEAVRERDCGAGRRRLRANPRWLRVCERLSSRKVLPRRETDHHWRRHERDSAARHRAASAVLTDLAERVLAGDARAIARAISLVEDEAPEAAALVRDVFAKTGRAYLVGITGPPGAGQSTPVDRLTAAFRTSSRVGRLAVPSTGTF